MVIVDAMNVRGCVPDGWWRDKPGALRRVVEAIAAHDWTDDEWVVVIADGRSVARGALGAVARSRGSGSPAGPAPRSSGGKDGDG